MAERTYAEKLELVYQSYERVRDIEVALLRVQLTDAERIALANDKELEARMIVCDAMYKEDLIHRMEVLASSESEGIRLQAIKELGKMFYPKRFRETLNIEVPKPIEHRVTYRIVDPVNELDTVRSA